MRVLGRGQVKVRPRHNPVLNPFHDKLVAAGKPKLVALIASARKLLVILNAIVGDAKSWAAQKFECNQLSPPGALDCGNRASDSILGAHGFADRRGALAHPAVVERRFDRNGKRIPGHGAVWQRLRGEAARGKETGPCELIDNERRDNGGLAGSTQASFPDESIDERGLRQLSTACGGFDISIDVSRAWPTAPRNRNGSGIRGCPRACARRLRLRTHVPPSSHRPIPRDASNEGGAPCMKGL
jgi:hypothetical protein